ncbi:MAG: VWA domain-containing protein [Caldilineaceae bacterium]|nr:VWA domain-containing protein [Caldilineaceae bacterium]
MDLLWPGFLLLLGFIPVLIGLYIWMLRRRRRFSVRFSSLSLVRAALPDQSRWRRHLPFALFLLALASLILAVARPLAIVSVPAGRATIILSLDVSRSMCSTDIEPNRLQAAKAAALSFIADQPFSTQIGLVAFAGFAQVIQLPTSDQEVLEDAIGSLTTGRRTGIGNGILEALDALAETDPSLAPSARTPADPQPTPVPNGAYAPSIIVLLTDGANNVGVEPLAAAQQALDRGIRVYTIGFGTARGGSMNCGGFVGSEPFSGFGSGNDLFGGGGGGGFRRGIDEDTLIQVSDMTGGAYYAAESAAELQEVFENLPTSLITRHETTEISFAFVAAGAFLALLAIGLAMRWNPLP